MTRRRVGVEPFWDSLLAGRSGVATITAFDSSPLKVHIAGEIKGFDPDQLLSPKTVKRSARFAQIGIAAALEAFTHAGLEPAEGDAGLRGAIVIGSGIGAFDMFEREHESFIRRGVGKFHPLTVPMIIPNAAAGTLAGETGFRGPNLSVSTACATGGTAIGVALDLIRAGRADVAIAGSSESTVSPWAIDGYCQLRALSTRNDDPTTASRPFSLNRDGFVLAEGAAALILEDLDHARARGAKIHAELLGYGATADGYHMTAPDPTGAGAVGAMRAALADAGLEPTDVDLVNAHGTSTPINDAAETAAIHRAFGAHASKLMVQSTKSMTGHPIGGAASIESVACVLQLARGRVHPTINLHEPDPACDLDYVPNLAREAQPRIAMKNAFGFGGHNAVLVFRRWDE
ncbi:MAG: beta-ketoacyl-ACP synthase II [Candidatus Eisenbacteria bacterium]